MKLYYHKTDGGAEYYCASDLSGTEVGDLRTAVLRTDGNEIEIFSSSLRALNIHLKIN